ncbi:MAG: hypothetical protein NDI94_04835, partial [Candidatus Woesearchaeota archaeon]|nr:hypothetical protein [Candidatus Woesearchaeota archaeon]
MKSQVTVFVIIMLVAVIVASIMFSNSNKKQVDIIKESEDVNLKQVTPVKIYIEQAMQKLLLEGYFLIGRQGGKIYKTTWPDCQEEDPFYKQSYRMCNQTGMHDYGPEFPKYLEKSPYQHKRIAVGINHTRVDGFTTFSSDEPLRQ